MAPQIVLDMSGKRADATVTQHLYVPTAAQMLHILEDRTQTNCDVVKCMGHATWTVPSVPAAKLHCTTVFQAVRALYKQDFPAAALVYSLSLLPALCAYLKDLAGNSYCKRPVPVVYGDPAAGKSVAAHALALMNARPTTIIMTGKRLTDFTSLQQTPLQGGGGGRDMRSLHALLEIQAYIETVLPVI